MSGFGPIASEIASSIGEIWSSFKTFAVFLLACPGTRKEIFVVLRISQSGRDAGFVASARDEEGDAEQKVGKSIVNS